MFPIRCTKCHTANQFIPTIERNMIKTVSGKLKSQKYHGFRCYACGHIYTLEEAKKVTGEGEIQC